MVRTTRVRTAKQASRTCRPEEFTIRGSGSANFPVLGTYMLCRCVATSALVLLASCGEAAAPAPATVLDGGSPMVLQPRCPFDPTSAGCPCEAGTAPATCFLFHDGDDQAACESGIRTCSGGTWSACHPPREGGTPPGGEGRRSSELILESVCNPCDPACFDTLVQPEPADLTPENTSGLVYDMGRGGLVVPTGSTAGTFPDCGDGTLGPFEECDDGNRVPGDGCSEGCFLEDGFACAGVVCTPTTCGDGVREGREECDDGNLEIGDGCTPFCDVEPSCSGGSCTPVCGDAQLFPGEQCDDGNLVDGDGCSSACLFEAGFSCVAMSSVPPDSVEIPIVYRDMREFHPDFWSYCCSHDTGMVEPTLSPDGLPVPIIGPQNPSLTTASNFAEWYSDSPASVTIPSRVTVVRQADGTYVFDSASFFPLDGLGWTALGDREPFGHNFFFTSEVRVWFVYTPGQTLSFRGDDDVWVFINGVLAVDIGGVHTPIAGSVTLDTGTEGTFGLTPGGLYEAVVLQAERFPQGSNYRLTLGGFVFGETDCQPVCGDGVQTRFEACDDGVNDGSPGTCNPGCGSVAPVGGPEGTFTHDYSATESCAGLATPVWERLSWETEAPTGTRVRLEVSTGATPADLDVASPVVFEIPSGIGEIEDVNLRTLFEANGWDQGLPLLRVRATLERSADGLTSPVLQNMEVRHFCTGLD